MAIRPAVQRWGAANRSPYVDACLQRVGGGAGGVKNEAGRDHWARGGDAILTGPGASGSNSGPSRPSGRYAVQAR